MLYSFRVSVDSFLLLFIPLVLLYPSLSQPLTPFIQPGVMFGRKSRHQLTIISANVRGLLTNIGDLVNSHATRGGIDATGHTGPLVVSLFLHKSLLVQPRNVDLPNPLEIFFFKIWAQHQTVLLCVCYRPQWQVREPIVFLQTHLDELLQLYTCNHVVIVGDMNQHLVARSFKELLTVHGLFSHVDFPTHISGSSFDPVVSDLPDSVVTCSPLNAMGSSNHMAILTLIQITPQRDAAVTRTNWLWGKADWKRLCNALQQTPWNSILVGDLNNQVHSFTHTLLKHQEQYVPCHSYTVKPLDQPWSAIDALVQPCDKYSNGLNDAGKKILKPNLAVVLWVAKPDGPHSSSIKAWYQMMMHHHCTSLMVQWPPKIRTRQRYSHLFSPTRCQYLNPERPTPYVPALTNVSTSTFTITTEGVRQRMSQVDTNKALGPDNISPHIHKCCASQLATPLTTIFQQCITTGVWPTLWKGARVVAFYKRERGLIPRTTGLSFGFRINRSAADLLLQLSTTWQKSLDQGKDTFIIVLEIAGAFDKVWHHGLITKLHSLGIRGHLLHLLQDYLQVRFLRVFMNGKHLTNIPSMPVYHRLIPEAYADDCTLTFPCDSSDHRATVAHVNQVLQTIVVWGRRWQVDLAPEKTQVMLISRRHSPLDTPIPTILFDGRALPLQASISILGVEMNSALTFTGHVKTIARTAAWKLNCVRRISHLDSQGISALYAAQVRSLMEYAPLTWSSCPPSYLGLLDKIQHRAQHLICLKAPPYQSSPLMQPLQQRRDVAGLCVIYKTHKQSAPHLTALHQPWAQLHSHTTRAAATGDDQLVIPFARTETFLHSFLPRYTRMWNHLVQQTQLHRTTSLHTFKSAANAWIKQP
ncbi:uncharacterized protein [Penaeus vannamei]|uniref:uncharacterized protein n=1 Tax=Penaeus vannamei TaxID=6689 RepID=UPI00387FAF69